MWKAFCNIFKLLIYNVTLKRVNEIAEQFQKSLVLADKGLGPLIIQININESRNNSNLKNGWRSFLCAYKISTFLL